MGEGRSCSEIRIGVILTKKMIYCFVSLSRYLMRPMARSISAQLKRVVGHKTMTHILHIGLGNCLNRVKIMVYEQETIYSLNRTHSLCKPPMHKWDTTNIGQTALSHSYLRVDISRVVGKEQNMHSPHVTRVPTSLGH